MQKDQHNRISNTSVCHVDQKRSRTDLEENHGGHKDDNDDYVEGDRVEVRGVETIEEFFRP